MGKESNMLKLGMKINALELLEHIYQAHKKAVSELTPNTLVSASGQLCSKWLEDLIEEKKTEVLIDFVGDGEILQDFIDNFKGNEDDEE